MKSLPYLKPIPTIIIGLLLFSLETTSQTLCTINQSIGGDNVAHPGANSLAFVQTFTACDAGELKEVTFEIPALGSNPDDLTVSLIDGGVRGTTLAQVVVDASFGTNIADFTSKEVALTNGNSYGLRFTTNGNFRLEKSTSDQYAGGSRWQQNPTGSDTQFGDDLVFSVIIGNPNESPTDISLTTTEGNPLATEGVDENNALGALAELQTTDPDASDSHTYSLSGADAASFSVLNDGGTYYLSTARIFNFESKSSYDVTITSTDQDGETFSKDFTIPINDVASPELVSQYLFSNGSLTDESGRLDAVFNGSPTTAEDRFSQTNSSYGTSNNNYIQVTDPIVNLSQDFTINYWFYVNSLPSFQSYLLDSRHRANRTEDAGVTTLVTSAGKLEVTFYRAGAQAIFQLSNLGSIGTTTWSMFSLVHENGVIKVYQDGQEIGSGTPSSTLVNGELWNLGGLINNNRFLNGRMDDLSFYAEALSPSEINSLYYLDGFGNNAPTDISLSNNSLSENEVVGTVIGTLTTTDSDTDDSHTYTLSGTDASSFSIDGNQLKSAIVTDFESKSSYDITITTDDGKTGTFEKDFTINITDVIELVENLDEDFTGIANTPLPNLPSGWLNLGNAVIFSEYLQLTTTAADAILVTPGIENLHLKRLSFTGRTESSGGMAVIEIFIKDVANTDLSGLSPLTTVTINGTATQNFSVNFKALGVASTDGNYVALRLTQANTTGVAINRLDDFLTIDESDFGLVSKYLFTNNDRSDSQGTTGDLVTVVNDFGTGPNPSSDRFGSSNNALETGFDKYVYVPNPVVDLTQDFTINEWFNISSFGSEDGATLLDSRFRSNGSQGGGLTLLAMKTGTLSLGAFKSTAGFENTLSLSNMGIFRENEWHMATVTRESGTIHVYLDGQLVGSGDPTNIENGTIWSLGGQNDTRPLRGRLDDVSFYNRALDAATLNELFLKDGFNKNRNPIDLILTVNPISEDAAPGTVIGTFSTSDADEGDTHTYEIIGDANIPSITINGADLVVEGQLDAEGLNPFRFNVTTTDAGGLSFQKLVEFEILDVNEAPTDIALNTTADTSPTFSVAENNTVGNTLITLLAIDEDEGDSHIFTLSGTDASAFSISENNLLVSAISFDFETQSNYELTITTEDAGGLSFSKDYTINITNNNDASTDILFDGDPTTEELFVDELNTAGDSIGAFITVDQDVDDTFEYGFVTSSADETFSIEGNTLKADVVLDYEASPSYTFTVFSFDGSEQFNKQVTVNINNVNEAPTDLFFVDANPDFRVAIDEGNAINDSIATIGTSDPDTGDTHTFSLSGNGAEDFTVDGNILRAAKVFDYNEETIYTLTITAEDAGGLTYSEQVNVLINDVVSFGPNQELGSIHLY